MEVSWDDRKNEANFVKHAVRFEEALTVLFDPMTLCNENENPKGNRFEYLGHSDRFRLLFVVTEEKTDSLIRVISARKATKNERRKYEEGI